MTCCKDCMDYELTPDKFGFEHEDPTVHIRPQWPMKQVIYVVYRIVVAIAIVVWICYDCYTESTTYYRENVGIWFIFATNWSFLLLGMCTTLQAITVTHHVTRINCYDAFPSYETYTYSSTPPAFMLQWCLYSIASNGALVVSLSYWSFLTVFDHSGFLITTMSKIKHSLNTAYIIFDLLLSAQPVRLFHVVYPLLFGALYSVFNAVYFTNNGPGPYGQHYAYYVLDWKDNPLVASLFVGLVMVLTVFNQIVLYQIYVLRAFIYKKIFVREASAQSADAETGLEESASILKNHENHEANYSSTNGTLTDTKGEHSIDGATAIPLMDIAKAKDVSSTTKDANKHE